MYELLYDLVLNFIGTLPPELTFVYGFLMIFLFVFLCLIIVLPFYIMYKIWS